MQRINKKEKIINEKNHHIRIKDIAEQAGVSIGTIDRVLHGRGEVSEETREKVLLIVKKLNYKPNIIASALATRENIRIAVFLPKAISDEAYWKKPRLGVEKAMEETRQYGIEIKFFQFDIFDKKSFIQEAEELVKWNPQGAIIAPIYYRESVSLIANLQERSIPYVFIDSNIPNQSQLSYIGQDSFQSGYLSARLLDLCIPERTTILIINFAQEVDNLNHLRQREEGFRSYFKNNDLTEQKKLVSLTLEDVEDDHFMANLTLLLKEDQAIRGIFVTSSKVYRIARLLEKTGKSKIRIVGYDLIPKNITYLKKDLIDFLINQRPEEQGYKAFYALFDHLINRKSVEGMNLTPIDIITKENIDYQKSI